MEAALEAEWLSARDLSSLRSLGTARVVAAGTTLFVVGDEPSDLMIIESGNVKLVTVARTGQELVINVLGAGEILGELSAIDGEPRSATAIAVDEVRLTVIPIDGFLGYLREHPTTMGALLSVVVKRLRLATRRQIEFVTEDTVGRVCGRLAEVADRYGREGNGSSVRIDLEIDRSELAHWCGLSPDALVAVLDDLTRRGWIETNGETISIVERRQIVERGEV